MVFSSLPNKGYIGSMTNILIALQNSIQTSSLFSQLLKTHPDFVHILEEYLKDKISKK
jgi:hypothetical protein